MTPQEIKQQAHKEFDKKFVKDSIMTNVRLIIGKEFHAGSCSIEDCKKILSLSLV